MPRLGRFFARGVYPDLDFRKEGSGFACLRNGLRLATGLTVETGFEDVHDRVGWTIFLQELWGLPDWARIASTPAAWTFQRTERRNAATGSSGDRRALPISIRAAAA